MSSAGKPQIPLAQDQVASSTKGKQPDTIVAQSSLQNAAPILSRDWLHTRQSSNDGKGMGMFRIMTWNVSSGVVNRFMLFLSDVVQMLAQCLVRMFTAHIICDDLTLRSHISPGRDLFPTRSLVTHLSLLRIELNRQ